MKNRLTVTILFCSLSFTSSIFAHPRYYEPQPTKILIHRLLQLEKCFTKVANAKLADLLKIPGASMWLERYVSSNRTSVKEILETMEAADKEARALNPETTRALWGIVSGLQKKAD